MLLKNGFLTAVLLTVRLLGMLALKEISVFNQYFLLLLLPVEYADTQSAGGNFPEIGYFKKAADLLEDSLQLYDLVHGEPSPSYAHPCSYLSVIHHHLGNYSRSKEMADKVYNIFFNGTDVPVGPGMIV